MAIKYRKFGKAFTNEVNGSNYCEISISHRKGGINAWNGQNEIGGIEVCINPVKRKEERGMIVTSYTMFENGAFRVLVAAMERFSQKKFDSIVEQVTAKLDEIVKFVEDGNREDAVRYIRSNIGLNKAA